MGLFDNIQLGTKAKKKKFKSLKKCWCVCVYVWEGGGDGWVVAGGGVLI